MKTLFSIIFLSMLLMAIPAGAQINPWPNSGTTVYGQSNTPAMDTNTPTLPVKQLQGFQISNITNISGSYTGTVWKSFNPTNITGAIAVGQFVFTGAASFSSNFPAINTNPPVYTIFSAGSGTNTAIWNFIYGP